MLFNDRTITAVCTPPTHVTNDGTGYPMLVFYEDSNTVVSSKTGDRYGLVNRPIRKIELAELPFWKPMISPFVGHQVRGEPLIDHDKMAHMHNVAYTYARPDKERKAARAWLQDPSQHYMKRADEGHEGELITRRVLSYGLSSAGYDVRLADEFKIFSNANSSQIDPKNLDEGCLVDGVVKTDTDGARYVLLPPNSYLLGHTVETFDIPRDVMVVALGKSTYARAGAIVNVTPIEPGFRGSVVIEVSNSTPLPLRLYAGEGIAQFLFFRSEPCLVSYDDRNGKYQDQQGLVLPKV